MAGGTCPTRSDLILEQRGLREGITEALQDGDYSFNDDAVAEFVLKISRRGTGLDTSYSVLPKPSKVTKQETEAMAEVDEMNVASLTEGSHPFVKPAAEFTTATAGYEVGSSPAGLEGDLKDF